MLQDILHTKCIINIYEPTIIKETRYNQKYPETVLLLLLSRFSRVRLCATPQRAAHQAPPSLGFSRQEHWSGLPCPPPGDLSDPGIEPSSPVSGAGSPRNIFLLQAGIFLGSAMRGHQREAGRQEEGRSDFLFACGSGHCHPSHSSLPNCGDGWFQPPASFGTPSPGFILRYQQEPGLPLLEV